VWTDENKMFALKYAYKSLMRRKQKNLTIIIAIALGVALYVGVQMGDAGLKETIIKSNYDTLYRTDLQVSGELDPLIPQNITDTILEISSADKIASLDPRIEYYGAVYSDGLIENDVLISGIDPSIEDAGEFGTFLNEDNADIDASTILTQVAQDDPLDIPVKALVSTTMSEELTLDIGDEMIISFDIGNGSFVDLSLIADTIFSDTKGRGIEGSGEFSDRTSHVYIHLFEFQRRLLPEFRNHVNYIAITLDTEKTGLDRSVSKVDKNSGDIPGKGQITDIEDEIRNRLEFENMEDIRVYSRRIIIAEDVVFSLNELTGVLNLFVYILNTIALLLIVNVQIMSVDDRKNQTAVLRAIGAAKGSITRVFLIEASVVGILGGLLGTLFGIPISTMIITLVAAAFNAPTGDSSLDPGVVIQAVIFGIIISIITAVLPAMRSTGESVANALRGISAPKQPRKGYLTLIFGVLFVIFGLMSTQNAGWKTFEDQQSMVVALGLTIAGLAFLLTTVMDRRISLSIAGFILWGLAVFVLLVSIKWAESGNPNNLMTFIMFYSIIGATLLISANYDIIMKSLSKALFVFPKLRPIARVTTTGMVGRKTRGVLVFTIFSIILTMNVMIFSTAESIKIGVVDEHNWRTDGVDVVVDVQTPVPGIAENISSIETVQNVFAFRKTWIPFYRDDPSVPGLIEEPDVNFIPVTEVPESVINPSGDWGEDSLRLIFWGALSGDEDGAVSEDSIEVGTSNDKHRNISAQVFDSFYTGRIRSRERTYTVDQNREKYVTEIQQMIIGGTFGSFAGIGHGQSIYMENKGGEMEEMYVGANMFDMMGEGDSFGWGLMVTPSIAQSLPQFDRIPNPNLFLVRSSVDWYDSDSDRTDLANEIETRLNDLSDDTSLSSIYGGLLVGATSRIVKEEVEEYNFANAAFWDFLGIFTSIGLFIGVIGMSIIAIRSVSERIREIGMMRSIGFERKSVVQGVIIEIMMLSLLGLIVGLINGILFTIAIARNMFGVPEHYPTELLTLYIAGVIFISVIAGVIPGYRASRVTPSQALRYTG
jgi:ABC-type antimicrobial peptide transport system permease subunit